MHLALVLADYTHTHTKKKTESSKIMRNHYRSTVLERPVINIGQLIQAPARSFCNGPNIDLAVRSFEDDLTIGQYPYKQRFNVLCC